MKRAFGIAIGLLIGLLLVQAQEQVGEASKQGESKPPAENRVRLPEVLQELATQYSAKVVYDPSLQDRVKRPTATTLEGALDEIVRQLPSLTWRKVFVRKELGAEPATDKILSSVRFLLNIELSGVMALDTHTNRLHSFLRDWPVGPDFEQSVSTFQPPYREEPYYVVLNPRLSTPALQTSQQSRVDQYTNLQQQMMNLLSQMSPQEREKAIRGGMQMMFNLDPSIRSQLMMEGMRMSMEWWQTLPPDQQMQFMEQGMRFWRQFQGDRRDRPDRP